MILGYIRVSTEAQRENTSLEEQERIIRGLAQMRGANNFDIAIFADPAVSGSIPLSKRPEGNRLLATARKGDVIVATKLDRLFRSATDALSTIETLKANGVELILIDMGVDPVTGNGQAKFFFTILAGVAEFERSLINDRMESGRQAKLARGGHVYGHAAYGYRLDGEGKTSTEIPDEQEQKIIEIMVEMRKTTNIPGVVKYLEENKIFNRNGGPFQYNQVQRILRRIENKSGNGQSASSGTVLQYGGISDQRHQSA